MKNKLLIFLLVLPILVFGQKSSLKFGKIDKADFAWDKYQLDSNAHAVVLYDFGNAELSYEPSKGDFQIQYHRHIRIKIIDKAGINWSNHTIPLWMTNRNKEKLGKFKAATYNMSGGKISENKVDKKALFEEKVHDNQMNMKVAMPNVQEGSIVEFEYSMTSPFYWNFNDWYFQYKIPVKYCEFNVAYPEWFDYNMQSKGYDFDYLTVNENTKGNDAITFTNFRRSGGYDATNSRASTNRIDYVENRYRWVAENMPALEAEAYTSNINNYMTRIDFELASLSIPGAPYQNFTNSWAEINTLLMESTSFGKLLTTSSKSKFLKIPIQSLTGNVSDNKEKVAIIYQHLKEKVLWNKRYGTSVSKDLKETYEKGTGNVADINLLLVAMLQKSGITAHPVILSTKDNGFLNPYFPSLQQFNYVIAQAQLEGKTLLLDATDRDLPINLLPTRCFNDKGRVITKAGSDWIELIPSAAYSKATVLDLQLNEDNQWEGTIKSRDNGYAASSSRKKINDQKEGKKNMDAEEDNITLIQNSAVENLKDLTKSLKKSAEIKIDNVMDGGDLLYFNPMTTQQMEENPFKLDDRKYPIDFSYPISMVYSAKFALPEGYQVEEVPEDVAVALPDKAGFFSYNVKFPNNVISVNYQLKINKALFYAEEYHALKEFYDRIVDKHAAQIVLKKTSE